MEVSPEKDIKGSFVIDRNTWLRGEGGRKSFLLRSKDDKMCCVGFFAIHCKHVSPRDLRDLQTISELIRPDDGGIAPLGELTSEDELYREFSWLEEALCGKKIYTINDQVCGRSLQPIIITEANREALLTQKFAELGYKVTFIN